MRLRFAGVFMLGSFLALAARAGAADDPAELLAKKLGEFPGAERGQVLPITSPALGVAFPNAHFYVLRFRQYPLVMAAPAPLQANNLFVVRADGASDPLVNTRALEAFFRAALRPATTDAGAKEAANAWLRLVEEFHQDGFFQFSIPDDSVKIVPLPNGGREVTGMAQVAPHGGDQGQISASLTFSGSGQLLAASESANLKRGVRPICQATKLLDPDPVVRRMAEDAILVMGKAAEEYLSEQRARATPALREAIDRIWQRILIEER